MAMTDRVHAEVLDEQAARLLATALPQADAIFADVAERLRK
jgi:hypothetical protein